MPNTDVAIRGSTDMLLPRAHSDRPAKLLVIVHSWMFNRGDHRRLVQTLAGDPDFGDFDIFRFNYDSGFLSSADPQRVAQSLADAVDDYFTMHKYSEVFFVGHSLGGLIARACVVYAHRRDMGWVKSVRRLLLLASANRGFWPSNPILALGAHLGHIVFPKTLIQRALRDSPFVLNLRLDWLKLDKEAPPAIQLLGSADDVVDSSDSPEFSGSGGIYQYEGSSQRLIEGRTHRSIASVLGPNDDYYKRLKRYLLNGDGARGRAADIGSALGNDVAVVMEPPKDNVIIAMHGIRDPAEWLTDLSTAINTFADGSHNCTTVAVDYPYFTILSFLRRGASLRKARLLFAEYLQAKAIHRTAAFHFVGHSNGTYIFTEALKAYPAMAFSRVYFCGSMLPETFPWADFQGRFEQLRNDCANRDRVVGVLCEGLNRLGLKRIGSAGYLGFREEGVPGTRVKNFSYLEGAHGAAKFAENYHTVADFLLSPRDAQGELPGPPWIVGDAKTTRLLNRNAFWIVLAVLGLSIVMIVGPWVLPQMAAEASWIRATVSVVAGAALVWLLTTF